MTLSLRPMVEDDLPLLVSWFRQEHVRRWWRETLDLDHTRAKYLPRLRGERPTTMITVLEDDVPIGLAQWYRWDDYAEDRDNYRIGPGEVGIDYTIGELTACYRGIGTELVSLLLALLRSRFPPGTAVSVTPEAANLPSCRILQKNGFRLIEVFQSEHLPGRMHEGPTAVYRRTL
jgi:RimJ/RimL family protein N-acetyltransferase